MNKVSEDKNIDIVSGMCYCPVCNNVLDMRYNQDNIPYFGDVIEVSSVCSCGFKFADTIILGQKEPLKHIKKVSSESDMFVRVIRSTSGTMRIPEWGVDIEPGPASEAFISNVEGVLDRIETVVNMVLKWAETSEECSRANDLLEKIRLAKDGKEAFTLVIEDPLGNSAILGEDVEVIGLTPEEISSLHTGIFIVQK
jgi:zinc finger protein